MTEEELNNQEEESQEESQGESQEETNYNSYVWVDGEWKHVNLLLNSGFLSATQLALALTDYYTASETDTLLATKANQSTTYTKTETDTLLNAKANSSAVYIKSEVDTALNLKADSSALASKADVSSLSSKADVSTTYTKTETDNAISTALTNFEFYEVVQTLPTTNIKTNRAYMVRNSNSSGTNLYDVYVYVNSSWEKWDSIELDVSNFASASTTYTKSEVDALLVSDEIVNSSSNVNGSTVTDAIDNLNTALSTVNTLLTNLNTLISS